MNTIQDGANQLLLDVASILSEFDSLEYMVIGGWCPFKRYKGKFSHPGTLDVDLLFKDSYHAGAIRDVIKSFIENQFLISAKHSFQLLKPYEINGKTFVYNVDLLHPGMAEDAATIGMFVDHLDLETPITLDAIPTKGVASIVLPNSKHLFRENLYTNEIIGDQKFKLLTFDGLFLTKMDSCKQVKRPRDSFDIFLAFESNSIDLERVKSICDNSYNYAQSVARFIQHLKEKGHAFDHFVAKYCSIDYSASKMIMEALFNGGFHEYK